MTDSDHVQVERWDGYCFSFPFNHCSLTGCVSGMPGSGCSRWAVHSFQEPRGGV